MVTNVCFHRSLEGHDAVSLILSYLSISLISLNFVKLPLIGFERMEGINPHINNGDFRVGLASYRPEKCPG